MARRKLSSAEKVTLMKAQARRRRQVAKGVDLHPSAKLAAGLSVGMRRRQRYTSRKCDECGQDFDACRSHARFCSPTCRKKRQRQRLADRVR